MSDQASSPPAHPPGARPDPGAAEAARLAALAPGLAALRRLRPASGAVASGGVSEPVVVVVAGVPRSGSTWAYNAARLVLARVPGGVHAAWHADYRPADHADAGAHLVKLHDPADLVFAHDLVVTTVRPLDERLASLIRMGWLAQEAPRLRNAALRMAALDAFWAGQSDIALAYDSLTRTPDQALASLAARLGVALSPAEALALAATLDALPEAARNPDKRLDHHPQTLLHAGHRGTPETRAPLLDWVRAVLAETPLAGPGRQ